MPAPSAEDVAGGTGSALCSILATTPDLRGTVFDLPHVGERARAFIAAQGLADRCEFTGGSFFESVPSGAGAYFMKHILHDWGDEDCARILAVCRKAMDAKARLLVCERIVPPGNEPSSAKLIDLHMMMTNHGGKERTEREYRNLLSAAGFELRRVVPTSTPWSVIEAMKNRQKLKVERGGQHRETKAAFCSCVRSVGGEQTENSEPTRRDRKPFNKRDQQLSTLSRHLTRLD